jgi:putative transposase
VFLTVSTHPREVWLADSAVQAALHGIWLSKATAWLVSDYLLMPDHLHLFCAPRDPAFSLERWIAFWKDQFAKTGSATGSFQSGGFHHRLRNGESYAEKWTYVRCNPVRAGLVRQPEEWPYSGRIHTMLF